MANTTSGTTTFDKTFSIEEIIEDAFERIGLNSVAGYQLKSARRSLNILFQEWGNRGIHYWEVGSTNLDLKKVKQIMIFLDQAVMERQQQPQILPVCLVYPMFLKHN